MALPPQEQQPTERSPLERERSPEQQAERPETISAAEMAERIGQLAQESLNQHEARVMAYEQAVANLGERLPDNTRLEVAELLESTRPKVERLKMILDVLRQATGIELEGMANSFESANDTTGFEQPAAETQTIPVTELATPMAEEQPMPENAPVPLNDLDVVMPQQAANDNTAFDQLQGDDKKDDDLDEDDDQATPHDQAGPKVKIAA